MRKIINNRAYDTSTSRLVGEAAGEDGVCRGLYRKRTGEYFLCVAGDDARLEGARPVAPLDYESARRWAESCLAAGEYAAEFGAMPEGDEETVLSVRVPVRAERILERWCSRTGEAKGAAVGRIIVEYLSGDDPTLVRHA